MMAAEFVLEYDKKAFDNLVKDFAEGHNEAAKKTVEELSRRWQQRLLQPTSTWRHDVNSTLKIQQGDDTITGTVEIRDTAYYYLNFGTRVRRALLSPDWQSKTTPGSFRAGPGRGRVILISKKLSLPGIKKRDWLGKSFDEIDDAVVPTYQKHAKKVK